MGWLRRLLGGAPPDPPERIDFDYPVRGEPGDPLAEALRAWLVARSRLEHEIARTFPPRRIPIDFDAITGARVAETAAWQEFRRALTMGSSDVS